MWVVFLGSSSTAGAGFLVGTAKPTGFAESDIVRIGSGLNRRVSQLFANCPALSSFKNSSPASGGELPFGRLAATNQRVSRITWEGFMSQYVPTCAEHQQEKILRDKAAEIRETS